MILAQHRQPSLSLKSGYNAGQFTARCFYRKYMQENIVQHASQQTPPIKLDTVIFGAGIAGLWLLNRLQQQGRECLLLETKAIGSGQTIASQGMIHGGLKYALGGALSGASEAVAQMPELWKACLAGNGDIDLRDTRILSEDFYMWSGGGLGGKLSSFFASKALRGRVDALKRAEYPEVFQNSRFKGKVYRLVDLVLDVPSLLENLSKPYQQRILQIDADNIHWQRSAKHIDSVSVRSGNMALTLQPRNFVFTAGEGNGALLESLHIKAPVMQLRPLQQVIVRHQYPYRLFGHCVDLSAHASPRLTISSHLAENGDNIWYLGGDLATENVNTAAETLITKAKQELTQHFPWLDWQQAQWSTLWINRAEAKQNQLIKPDNAFAEAAADCDNLVVAWPTKLTLAPDLANRVMPLLAAVDQHTPGIDTALLEGAKVAAISEPFWHKASYQESAPSREA